MKPTIGPANLVIAQAIELGILCRPVELGWIGSALAPTKDSFEKIEAETNNYLGLYHPTPGQIMLDWMLTTKELIESEYRESMKEPF